MKISELARRCGLARSTLLYYEKLGIIEGSRAANGYRHYDEGDLQRLQMVQALQAGGSASSSASPVSRAKSIRGHCEPESGSWAASWHGCSGHGICWRIWRG